MYNRLSTNSIITRRQKALNNDFEDLSVVVRDNSEVDEMQNHSSINPVHVNKARIITMNNNHDDLGNDLEVHLTLIHELKMKKTKCSELLIFLISNLLKRPQLLKETRFTITDCLVMLKRVDEQI